MVPVTYEVKDNDKEAAPSRRQKGVECRRGDERQCVEAERCKGCPGQGGEGQSKSESKNAPAPGQTNF